MGVFRRKAKKRMLSFYITISKIKNKFKKVLIKHLTIA